MSTSLQSVFSQLRELLKAHAVDFTVARGASDHYGLEAAIGPATVQAWGGKIRAQSIPVAWVKLGKRYVSFHLMGVSGNAKLMASLPEELRARMQGTSCFNFATLDQHLVDELGRVTAESLRGMRKAGYISDRPAV